MHLRLGWWIPALIVSLAACSPAREPQRPAGAAVAPTSPARVARPALEVGDRAPAFVVPVADGSTIDLADVLGKRPLVLLFFTTWCPWCERAMPLVHQGLEGAAKDVLVIGVSLDDETFSEVPGYLARHRLAFPVVRALGAKEFTLAYDPGGRIPHFVVVGRDGVVIDIQPGYDPDQAQRLKGALELAERPVGGK